MKSPGRNKKAHTTAFTVIKFLAVIALFGFIPASPSTLVPPEPFPHFRAADMFDYNFNLRTLDDRRVKFSEFKGKVVFLNMWATWCAPCRAEMPSIQELYKTAGSDVVFVMLSIDADRDVRKVKSFVKDNAFTFPVYMPSGDLPSDLQVPLIPTTFIINRSGKVVYHMEGQNEYNTKHFVSMLSDLSTRKTGE